MPGEDMVKPPPHPESTVSAAIINTPRAAQRRRRLAGTKKNPARARVGAASGQAEPARAAAVVEVLIVNVEVAEVLPGVTVDCEKVAVAPGGSPVAVRVTAGIVAPFCALTMTENCADSPREIDCAGVDEATTKSGVVVPVPVRLTVCGEPVALSVTRMLPVALPVVTGAKVTEMAQLAPAASDAPQLLVSLNSPIRGELGAVMPVMVSGTLPVLLSVTVCAAEVVPAAAVKLSDAGVRTATGAEAAVPVPLSATVCGEPLALSVTARAAL